jgi:hypothetical protein
MHGNGSSGNNVREGGAILQVAMHDDDNAKCWATSLRATLLKDFRLSTQSLCPSDFTTSSKTPKLESATRKMLPGKEVRQGDTTNKGMEDCGGWM